MKSVSFYYREGSSGSSLSISDLDMERIKHAYLLHTTGITLAISDSAREASMEAVNYPDGRGLPPPTPVKINRIMELIRKLEVGAVYVNDAPKHGIGYFPFGGRKDSGVGREGIGYTIEHVTAVKTIVYNYKGRNVWKYM